MRLRKKNHVVSVVGLPNKTQSVTVTIVKHLGLPPYISADQSHSQHFVKTFFLLVSLI